MAQMTGFREQAPTQTPVVGTNENKNSQLTGDSIPSESDNVATTGMFSSHPNSNLVPVPGNLNHGFAHAVDTVLVNGPGDVDTELNIGTSSSNIQCTRATYPHIETMRRVQEEYNTIKYCYGKLLCLANETQATAIEAEKIKEIGTNLYEFATYLEARSFQETDLTGNVVIKRSNSAPPSTTNISTYNIRAECALGLFGDHCLQLPRNIEFYPVQTQPDAIGFSCDKYMSTSALAIDHGVNIPSKGKRKLCSNKFCATRRHLPPVKITAKRVSHWIKNSSDETLSTEWVHLEGPPDCILTGIDIRRFLYPSMLTFKMADALVWMLSSIENETMAKNSKVPGRHYVSPQWAMQILNDKSCLKSSYEMFMFPSPSFNIKRCNIVLTLECYQDVWSCLAFDIGRNTISIMDPNSPHPVPEERVKRHVDASKKLLPHLLYCMRKATGNNKLGRGEWTPDILLARGIRTSVQNSGIQALNCMRWYNGDTVCIPPVDGGAPQSRRDLIYQLLVMENNIAPTNVIAESMKEEGTPYCKKKR